MSAPELRFGVAHDFRCPPGSPFTLRDVYHETLEQVALLDALGLDLVWFSEHHFVEDGYLPNFVPVAGAVAGRTERIRIGTDIVLAPFAHPVRLAEDMAILDQLSNGRMELGIGLGYAPHEFKGFGIPLPRRVSLTEELVDVLQLAWRGERFSYAGTRYQFDDLLVTPAPVQDGGPPLWLAVTSPASAQRAARFGTHVLPQGVRSIVLEGWRERAAAAGVDTASRRKGIIRNVFVTDDPEREWPPLREAERYRMRIYGGFAEDAGLGGRAMFEQEGRISQRPIVGGVEHCVQELTTFIVEHGFTDVVTWGSAPGMRPSALTPHMERFVREVAPQVRAKVDAARAPSL